MNYWEQVYDFKAEKILEFFDDLSLERLKSLKDFQPILSSIVNQFDSFNDLKCLNILELGPGRNTKLFEYFLEIGIKITAVGLPKLKNESDNYHFKDINKFLSSKKDGTFQLIYSRYVLEENSFAPMSLLFSKQFLNLIKNGQTRQVMLEMPGSREYINQSFKLLYNKLEKNGLLISMVVDKKRSVLPENKNKWELKESFSLDRKRGLVALGKK